MTQSLLLLETLKRVLTHRQVTYRELARRMGQSESNIKRIFSQGAISLRALEQMCDVVGLELLDLARLSRPQEERAECFSRVQEEALAADPKLFALVYLILSDLSVRQVVSKYAFSETECRRYLLSLDKLGLIRLHPRDKIQVLISRNIRWIPGGPLNTRYEEKIKQEFLESDFSRANERLRFLNGRLSKHSLQSLSRRLDRLIAEFVDLAEIDDVEPSDDSVTIWFMLAYRPWRFSLVRKFRKPS